MDSTTLDRLAVAAQSDASAADALLEALQPQVDAVCRSRLPYRPVLAEEAAQDTLVAVWQSLPRWQAKLGPFGGWMNRIGSRRCVDLIRAARREVPCDIWVDEPTSVDASHPAAVADEYARVRAVMRRVLSRRAETVLVLRLAYDVPVHEVAVLLSMTPINVRVIQHRALSAVRAALEAGDA